MMSQEQTTANFCLCRSLFDKPNVGDNITVGALDERSVYPAVKQSVASVHKEDCRVSDDCAGDCESSVFVTPLTTHNMLLFS